MDVVSGLGFALLVIVVGAAGLAAFAVYLRCRDEREHREDQ